jgi:hypothetical protein
MPTPEEIATAAVADAEKVDDKAGDGDKGNGTDTTPDPAETSARAQGWKPKEEFTGDPALWVDAKEFVGRAPLFDKIKTQSKDLKEIRKTVDAMAKHFTANLNAAVNAKVAALRAEKKEAIEGGDVAKVEAIDKQIDDAKAAKADIPTAPEVAPEVMDWVKANPWYTKDQEAHDFALAYNDSYLKRHPGDIEGSLKATATATKRAFPEKFEGDTKPKAGIPAGTVEGGTTPVKGSSKFTVSRLNSDQKLAHDQYIKAGTFDAVAKAAKMTPTEYYVQQLDEIGELTK